MGNAQVHDHESEVVGEGVGDEEPFAAEVLEPNLRFRLVVFALVDEGEAAVFALRVDVESENFIILLLLRALVCRLLS